MRCINEKLARRASQEDQCKGRVWEGRFNSQALLDETALIKCMASVDLNPIRAKMAQTPESSAHTSIRSRILGQTGYLLTFTANGHAGQPAVPMRYADYLLLLDYTGRALRPGKRGTIPANMTPILVRLGMQPTDWAKELQYYGRWHYRAVGSIQALTSYAEHPGQQMDEGQRQNLNSGCVAPNTRWPMVV